MRLLRYGQPGSEKPGLLDGTGKIRDLSGHISDIAGSALSRTRLSELAGVDPDQLPEVDSSVRLGPCVGSVGKYICIGLNYSDHAAEVGKQVPPEPIIFLKANSAICGPFDNIELPRGSTRTDWEVELCVVIGDPAKYIAEEDALGYVAGYCVANDLSERDFQTRREGQWTKGKSCDTFGPLGPWLVTKSEMQNTANLRLYCEVDGHRYQDGSTRTMVYQVAYLVSYLSQFFTLLPGDVIATGTPPGVGSGQKPQVYLKEGQTVVAGIDGLGEQRQLVICG